MDIIDFYRMEQQRIHTMLRTAVSDLTAEEWHYIPGGKSNSIAFILWHCVRTEDNVLRFILLDRQPPIWNEGNWHERLALPQRPQGTGMSTEEAHTIQINDPALFMQYAEQVWREFEAYLAGITDGGAELSERVVKVSPLGSMPAIRAIGLVCIAHIGMHVGQIAQTLGILGKTGLSV